MHKHTITYKDYDDEEVTDELYFNIDERELIELEVEHKEGLQEWIKNIVASQDRKTMFAEFQRIILLAYGLRDGKKFVKNDQVREDFKQTAAFNALVLELGSSDDAAARFIQAVIPKDLAAKTDIEEAKKAVGITDQAAETPTQ